ncbi:23S rRNA (cytidine(2498)-2'-O)-methyltransferase RlmM, partial [Pseudoalteromonas sp. S3785]
MLHILVLANNAANVGYSFRYNKSTFFMGILRLLMPSDGPSRSTLNLDEDFN